MGANGKKWDAQKRARPVPVGPASFLVHGRYAEAVIAPVAQLSGV